MHEGLRKAGIDVGPQQAPADPVEALAGEVLRTLDPVAVGTTLAGLPRADRDALHAAIVQRAISLTRGGRP